MKRRIYLLSLLLLILPSLAFAGNPTKIIKEFANRDGSPLLMDIYSMEDNNEEKRPCLIFVFGGGFKDGTRDAELQLDLLNYMAKKGYTVASIDYRLGMKDKEPPTLFNRKPLTNAIGVAVEDLFEATKFLISNANEFNIDPSKIIISGSSAGAITVLQADYTLCNKGCELLPNDFEYAGVISFAGAIYSTEGSPKYKKKKPAPTLFFHGSKDQIVPYNKVNFFSTGMFGSKSITKNFKENNYPYCFYSIEGFGHSVAEYPMKDNLFEVDQFIKDYVINGQNKMMEIYLKDNDRTPDKIMSNKDYYKKEKKEQSEN